MVVDSIIHSLNVALELAQSSSFARFALLHPDRHLSSDVLPQSIEDIFEFLIKMLFVWVH